MTTTFVTAFFAPSTAYRSTDTYFEHFAKLANTGIPILLFLDTRYTDRTFPLNVSVIPMELDTSWLPIDVELPVGRNPQKDTHEYLCIQLQKLTLLNLARATTTTPFLAWIDFGVFHMVKEKEDAQDVLKYIAQCEFPRDKILAPGCWPAGQYEIWQSPVWRFCGSFLLGHRDLFEHAQHRQMELVFQSLPRITWEINYWTQMEDVFCVYKAYHDETLLARVIQFVQRHPGVDTCSSVPSEIQPSMTERTAS